MPFFPDRSMSGRLIKLDAFYRVIDLTSTEIANDGQGRFLRVHRGPGQPIILRGPRIDEVKRIVDREIATSGSAR